MYKKTVYILNKKGFTLVELLIVVVIMAILVAVAVPVYIAVTENSEMRTCNNNCKVTSTTLTNYMNGFISAGGDANIIPSFEIHNEDGNPVFRSIGGGEPSQDIVDLSVIILDLYQDSKSACCIGDGIITVEMVYHGTGAYVNAICSEHSLQD